MAWGFGFRVCRAWGFGFKVEGLGFVFGFQGAEDECHRAPRPEQPRELVLSCERH